MYSNTYHNVRQAGYVPMALETCLSVERSDSSNFESVVLNKYVELEGKKPHERWRRASASQPQNYSVVCQHSCKRHNVRPFVRKLPRWALQMAFQKWILQNEVFAIKLILDLLEYFQVYVIPCTSRSIPLYMCVSGTSLHVHLY